MPNQFDSAPLLELRGTITTHRLWVNANHYLPLDDEELPLPLRAVDETVFDFRKAKFISENSIPVLDGAMRLNDEKHTSTGLTLAAICEADGLQLSVSTDRPFLHLYGGVALSGHRPALGVKHVPGAGLCLETSDWPNGPANDREEVWYDANRAYTHTAEWRFQSIVA
jgi:aldose 1-epimerase